MLVDFEAAMQQPSFHAQADKEINGTLSKKFNKCCRFFLSKVAGET
jgi:hypothetical protein